MSLSNTQHRVVNDPQRLEHNWISRDSHNNNDIDWHKFRKTLWRRKKLIGFVFTGFLSLSVVISIYQRVFTPIFRGSFVLLITDPISNDKRSSAAADVSLFEQLALNTTNNDIPNLIEVLQSPLLLDPIAKRFQIPLDQLLQRINITTGGMKREEAEGILKVSLTSNDPYEDQLLLQAISKAYLGAALQQRQQRLVDGINFLNQQSPSLQEKADAIQMELADFRRRNSLLEPIVEGAALKKRELNLNDNILLLEAERSRLQLVRKEILNGSLSARGFQEAISTGGSMNRGGAAQGLAVSDADQSLLQQLIQVESELAEARSKYQPTSSMVQSLQARLDQIQPLLRSNQLDAVDAALSLNAGRLSTAREQRSALNKKFLLQPDLIKQYETLQSRLVLAQDNLAGLVRARETLQLETAQQSAPWRVIAPPVFNDDPISPSFPRNLALGFALGIAAGVGAGLFRERLDHVYHCPEDVQKELGLPLLGHVPYIPSFHEILDFEHSSMFVQDTDTTQPNALNYFEEHSIYADFKYKNAFLNLYTSIIFPRGDKSPQTICLTSACPSEGKSLVNVLLSKVLSDMGQRVLLVDADLRNPKIHTLLKLKNTNGLSNLLDEDVQHWREVMISVSDNDTFNLITAGHNTSDPSRLLSSLRFEELVHQLSNCGLFDLILFDTPPILGLADTVFISEHCDGLMLLTSLDFVDRSLPIAAVSRILANGSTLLGVVTNAVKPDTHEIANSLGYRYFESISPCNDERMSKTTYSADVQNDLKPSGWFSTASTRFREFLRWIDTR